MLQDEFKGYVRFLAKELGASLDRRRYSPAVLKHMAQAMAGYVTGYLSYRVITGKNKNATRDLKVVSRIFLDGIEGNGRTE
jgi:hypothetical protein